MIKRLLPILLLLAACDGPAPTAGDLRLDFQTAPQEGARAVVTPSFVGGSGSLTVSGTFTTPCLAQQVAGSLAVAGSDLLLTVSLVPKAICFTAIGYMGYTATVSGVEPGAHRVRVVYDYGPEAGGAHEVGDAFVRVQ